MKTNFLKYSLLSLFAFVFFFNSCKKDDTAPTIPTTVIPITITDITSVAYTDQSIMITGTGFNLDVTKDTIDFGGFVDNAAETDTIFQPAFAVPNAKTSYVVTSASATQLVIKALLPDSLYNGLFLHNGVTNNATFYNFRFRVRANKSSAISAPIILKGNPLIDNNPFSIYYTYQGAGVYSAYPFDGLAPGDTTVLTVRGVFSNDVCEFKLQLSCSAPCGAVHINPFLGKNYDYTSTVCTSDCWTTVFGCATPTGPGASVYGKIISYDKFNHTAKILFVMPYNFFGFPAFDLNKSNADQYLKTSIMARVINKDGKVSKPSYAMRTFVFPFH